jgi:endonuclease YncB( thermonuclease family)
MPNTLARLRRGVRFKSKPSKQRSWLSIFALIVVSVAIFYGLPVGVNDFPFSVFTTATQGGAAAQSSTIAGPASITDGDTIKIRGQRIRFFGIDAPESSQTCRDGDDREYRCGQRATDALSDKIGSGTVTCEQRDIDRYGRIVAVCRLGGEDLNAWLVRQGWAIAYRHYSWAYVSAEAEAKTARRGIWAGDFMSPYEYRRSH